MKQIVSLQNFREMKAAEGPMKFKKGQGLNCTMDDKRRFTVRAAPPQHAPISVHHIYQMKQVRSDTKW